MDNLNAIHNLKLLFLNSNLILSNHLSLRPPNRFFRSDLRLKFLYEFHYSCHKPRTLQYALFYHPNNVSWKVKMTDLLTMQFLYCPVTFPILGPNSFMKLRADYIQEMLATTQFKTFYLPVSYLKSDSLKYKSKGKQRLFLCLTKCHAMKTYGGVKL
jgi:hypothetical protein